MQEVKADHEAAAAAELEEWMARAAGLARASPTTTFSHLTGCIEGAKQALAAASASGAWRFLHGHFLHVNFGMGSFDIGDSAWAVLAWAVLTYCHAYFFCTKAPMHPMRTFLPHPCTPMRD